MKITKTNDKFDNSLSFGKELSSFRDDSGFVFKKEGVIYRSVSYKFKKDFDFFIQSGLNAELVDKNFLISHIELDNDFKNFESYKILLPKQLSFISYPYEWSFSMLLRFLLRFIKKENLGKLTGNFAGTS